MTRKEETRKASIAYQMSVKPQALGGDAFADLIEKCNVNPSFIAGAEWADRTMIDKACNGIEKLLSGYIIRNFHFGDSYEIDRLIEDFKKPHERRIMIMKSWYKK